MTTGRLRRRAAAVLTACATLALAACATIPMSGPVQQGDTRVSTPSDVDVLAAGPQPGYTPQQIVEGFLTAGAAGFSDNFVTAREYLAGQAKVDWEPLSGVVVAGPIQWAPSVVDAQVTGNLPVRARVDGDGRYVAAPADAHEPLSFDLVQDDTGEWRIAGTPDGLILQEQDFTRSFQSAALYFLSPDKTFLVPDTRWLPRKNLPTSVVRELLAGPSAWLRDAVTSAVPEGVELNPEAVLVGRDGVAHVSLTPAAAVAKADRPLLLAQIEETLRPIPGVGSVEVQTGGFPLEGAATLSRGNGPAGNVEFLQADQLVALVGGKSTPVPGIASLAGLDARDPASNEDGSLRVVLSGPNTLVTTPTSQVPSSALVSGTALVAPSVDRLGWVWTATSGGGVLAAKVGAAEVHVTADWLATRTVRALRVARDGTRIAVVSVGSDGVSIDVAAISRDESGAPQQLGPPIRAGASLVDAGQVVWVDESTLGVIGRSTGNAAVHLVPVSGPAAVLPEVANLASLAGGAVMYVTTTDGGLSRFVGSTWAPVAGIAGASDPSFPG